MPKMFQNLLPKDGHVSYLGKIFEPTESMHFFELLSNEIPWRPDEGIIFGKAYKTNRLVAWYGDEAYAYKYSHHEKSALPWTKNLLILKHQVEEISKQRFNCCLLNLYHDGNDGMSYHSDDESVMKKESAIASISFGAKRKFTFKHKYTSETISLELENGSLLIMSGKTQQFWKHALPKSKLIVEPRINLTFRTFAI